VITIPEGLQEKPTYQNGDKIHFLGQAVRLSIIPQPSEFATKACRIEYVAEEQAGSDEKRLAVYWPKDLGSPRPHKIRMLLVEWYKRQAKTIIKERVETWSKQMRLSYNRIAIKDQKTRWGSCSSLRNLNFNWRLVMAPLPVLDYVVVHELAHLVEMNHSKRFWDLVETHFPAYPECKRWLKQYGPTLFYL
jgi:predicted metal-dependent hydrolase